MFLPCRIMPALSTPPPKPESEVFIAITKMGITWNGNPGATSIVPWERYSKVSSTLTVQSLTISMLPMMTHMELESSLGNVQSPMHTPPLPIPHPRSPLLHSSRTCRFPLPCHSPHTGHSCTPTIPIIFISPPLSAISANGNSVGFSSPILPLSHLPLVKLFLPHVALR
jgi:hypothetical protein